MTPCMELLEESPEWANILDAWAKDEKMGLAQKRYDRLEWVHGGQMSSEYMERFSMQKTHDLELRPKHHYPTTVKSEDGGGSLRRSLRPWKDSWSVFPKTMIVIRKAHARTKDVTGGGRPRVQIFPSSRISYPFSEFLSDLLPGLGKEFQSSPIEEHQTLCV